MNIRIGLIGLCFVIPALDNALAQQTFWSQPLVKASSGDGFIGILVLIGIAFLIALPKIIDAHLSGRVKTGRVSGPDLTEDQVRQMFEKKQGDVSYEGTASATLLDDQTKKQDLVRLTFRFRLVRNISAMTHRDREFLKIFLLMNNRGWIDPEGSNRIHFGLVFGDGKAAVDGFKYSIPQAASRKYGINNMTDAVRWYSKEINVSTDAAISELMTSFNRMLQQQPDDPLVQEIQGLISSGNRWFGNDDIPGSAFDYNIGGQGVFIGLLPESGAPVAYYGEGSLATIAPPGAGKTQCHIIPNLLFWKGPVVALDVKGELWATTSAWRQKSIGPVYRFAPFEPERSHCYSPLTAIRSRPDFLWEDSALVAELMIIPRSKTDPYWEENAQRFLTAIIAYVCRCAASPQERQMSSVLDIASGVGWDDFLSRSSLDSEFPPLARAAANIERMDDKNRSGVLSQVLASLKSWEGTRVGQVTRKSDWSPLDLRSGTNPTIYICVKPEEIEAGLSVLRVFIGQHIRALTRTLPAHDDPEILFLLDEFPQLRRMQPLEEGVSVGRGYRMKLWLIAQSMGQIKTVYPNAEGLLGQCGLRAFMNPSLQDGTAQKVSDDLGHFDSILDASRQKIVEPQALSGPEFRNWQIVFTQAAKPIRLAKLLAYHSEGLRQRFGEATWSSM